MIKHKRKFVFGLIIVAILAFAYLWDGTPPSSTQNITSTQNNHLTAKEKIQLAQEIAENSDTDVKPEVSTYEPTSSDVETEVSDTCYISVRCDSVLNNLDYLDENKKDIIPDDGIIYENTSAVIYEGESAFNLLIRELKSNNIHYEYEKTPAYNSAYIEGIGNLYEFDCGELSGWLYKVNGKTPSCGCSQYILSPGDRVEFLYSCNLGIDVGGYKEVTN